MPLDKEHGLGKQSIFSCQELPLDDNIRISLFVNLFIAFPVVISRHASVD
jgi:hypothetical protein